jgi:hypothetical protein
MEKSMLKSESGVAPVPMYATSGDNEKKNRQGFRTKQQVPLGASIATQ